MTALDLRSVRVERLPDDEQYGEEAADNKAKAVTRGGLFQRARAAMTGNRVNSAANLAAALAALRKIEQRRLELIEWDKTELQAANALLGELESELSAVVVSRDGDLDAFRKSYHDWLGKHIALSPQIKTLREWIAGLSNQAMLARVDDPGNVARLKSQFPELKTILADALCGRAAQLRAEADFKAKEEQARLDKAHGVGEYDAEDTMPLKRARANCDYLGKLLERFQSEGVESFYLDASRYLLGR